MSNKDRYPDQFDAGFFQGSNFDRQYFLRQSETIAQINVAMSSDVYVFTYVVLGLRGSVCARIECVAARGRLESDKG